VWLQIAHIVTQACACAGRYTPAPFERVHAVHAWVQLAYLRRERAGGLAVSSSVLSRIPNALTQAMLAYEQCRCV
jgi:hypothetical protein